MWLVDRSRPAGRRMVVEAIPDRAEVVDLCCGPCAIAPALRAKGCRYVGLDLNGRFIGWGRRRGLDVRYWDARSMEVPRADVICMLSSLYQFIPDESRIFGEMLEKAGLKVIVSEPVRNWASSTSLLLRGLSSGLTRVDGQIFPRRHTQQSLDALVQGLPPGTVEKKSLGRELLLVIDVAAVRAARDG